MLLTPWQGRRELERAIARFELIGEARPDLLNRVVGLIAQLGLTPVHVTMRRLGDIALLGLIQDGLDPCRAVIVAEKMRALVAVSAVELSFQPPIAEDRR
jgi:hypothetical protein